MIRGICVVAEEIADGRNINILLRGQSGCGKTRLARLICNYSDYKNGTNEGFNESLCNDTIRSYSLTRRIIFLDEVHLLINPEFLYPLMDSGQHSFILATNEFGNLKEPLTNRCIQFNFLPYENEDLALIAEDILRKKRLFFDRRKIDVLIDLCRGTPRDLELLCKRLYFILRQMQISNPSADDIFLLLYENFSIKRGGFTDLDLRYINFLKEQGRAGLDTLVSALQIPRNVIRDEIEPFLIRKKIITITSRGRILCQ